ncbi:hypothetical protein [Streptomyces sp. NPDC003006]
METYTIHENDPLSARARSYSHSYSHWGFRLHRPELVAWDVTVESHSVVIHRTWERRIRRTAG